jgi:hypothetical protein
MTHIRDTHWFAFLQGTYEGLRYGTSAGRTHPADQDWNEAYDRGLNAADTLRALAQTLTQ